MGFPVRLFTCSESDKMQLFIRGNTNYVLEFATGNESLAEVKAQIAEKEGSEDVLLYVAGKPVDYEMPVSSIGDFHVDVPFHCWEERSTDPWLVLVRSEVKPPRLIPKKRRRRRLDAPRGGSNITEDLSMLFKPSAVVVDPTLIHNFFSVLYPFY